MEPTIVHKETFALLGLQECFTPETADFEGIWKRYMAYHDQIQAQSTDGACYGANFASADHSAPIDYLAGMAVRGAADAPEGAQAREVSAALYAVFECSFQEIGLTYGYIWGEWLQTSGSEQDTTKLGFDFLPPGTSDGPSPIEIWFPVRKKNG